MPNGVPSLTLSRYCTKHQCSKACRDPHKFLNWSPSNVDTSWKPDPSCPWDLAQQQGQNEADWAPGDAGSVSLRSATMRTLFCRKGVHDDMQWCQCICMAEPTESQSAKSSNLSHWPIVDTWEGNEFGAHMLSESYLVPFPPLLAHLHLAGSFSWFHAEGMHLLRVHSPLLKGSYFITI